MEGTQGDDNKRRSSETSINPELIEKWNAEAREIRRQKQYAKGPEKAKRLAERRRRTFRKQLLGVGGFGVVLVILLLHYTPREIGIRALSLVLVIILWQHITS